VINGGGVSGIYTKRFRVNMKKVTERIGRYTADLVRQSLETGELPTVIADRTDDKTLGI